MEKLTKQQRKNKAWKKYHKIEEPAWKKYQKIREPAWKKYKEIEDPALKKYQKKCEEIDNEVKEPKKEIEVDGYTYVLKETKSK